MLSKEFQASVSIFSSPSKCKETHLDILQVWNTLKISYLSNFFLLSWYHLTSSDNLRSVPIHRYFLTCPGLSISVQTNHCLTRRVALSLPLLKITIFTKVQGIKIKSPLSETQLTWKLISFKTCWLAKFSVSAVSNFPLDGV